MKPTIKALVDNDYNEIEDYGMMHLTAVKHRAVETMRRLGLTSASIRIDYALGFGEDIAGWVEITIDNGVVTFNKF